MDIALSIIIPFYGTANKALLDRCLASIQHQKLTSGQYEIIIAEDEGKGLGGARNMGIRQARGKYLLFIDADDYLFPNSLQLCIQTLHKENPDMLSFGYQSVNRSQQPAAKNKVETYNIYPSGAAFMATHNFMGTAWRHFFQREWFIAHQLSFPEKVFHEDEALVAQAYFLAGKTIIANWPVYAYFQHSHSILHKQSDEQRAKRMKDFRQILTTLQEYLTTQQAVTELQRRALARRIHFLTIDYLLQLWKNKGTCSFVRKELKALSHKQLLPLPAMRYSWKYSIAQFFINTLTRL